VHAEVEQSDKIETTFELPFGQDVIFYCQVGSCRWRAVRPDAGRLSGLSGRGRDRTPTVDRP
jgi:hypothetical protein